MKLWKPRRRRRRSKAGSRHTGMILLVIAASVVFAIISPPDPSPRARVGRSAPRPASTPARAAPEAASGVAERDAAPAREVKGTGAAERDAAPAREAEESGATERDAAPAREAEESGCFPHRQAWVSNNMNIRQRPSTSAAILGNTPPGERYKVFGSRQGEVYCWIDIDLGWIAVTRFVSAHEPQARAPTPPPASAATVINAAVQQALHRLNRLVVAPENRCSPYDSDDYPYPQSVEARIVSGMGGRVYGPYTGTTFNSRKDTDIEHIVAKSEAHDSGLCGANDQTRKTFARDLLNLTLASPSLNRHQKSGKDFAEWRPKLNKCWFADRVIKVKAKYSLTIDSREKAALQRTLGACSSLEMQ
ncbi:MAG: DUF1524 domain-containing protein [Chloroflexota bacterium]|nr:DUF1524 domain-containing protein [Chloroflexota bacterium]